MKIRWSRVTAMLFCILTSLLLATLWGPIVTFLQTMSSIVDPLSSPEEHLQGMMAFALVAVCVIGIIRLLLSSNRRGS